jgi:hypothetical protein
MRTTVIQAFWSKSTMMDRKSKESELTEKDLQEFLDNGGKITVCPPGARTEDIDYKGGGFYGRKKKKKEEK